MENEQMLYLCISVCWHSCPCAATKETFFLDAAMEMASICQKPKHSPGKAQAPPDSAQAQPKNSQAQPRHSLGTWESGGGSPPQGGKTPSASTPKSV